MRNIRIADLSYRPPSPLVMRRHRRDPLAQWLATLPIIALPLLLLWALVNVSAAGPTLNFVPGSVSPGGSLSVSGSGFERNETGVLHWDGAPMAGAAYRANGRGELRLSLSAPAAASDGVHHVTAVAIARGKGKAAEVQGGDIRAEADVVIVSGPVANTTPTPDPTLSPPPEPPSTQPTPTLAAAATPTVAPAATPTPAQAPSATPTPTPTVPVAVTCPSSLQALVDAASAGASVTVPACTYRETLRINEPVTLLAVGAVIDGEARRPGVIIRASNVTIVGLTVRDTLEPNTWAGGVDVRGVSGLTLRNLRVFGASSMGIYVDGGAGHLIEGSHVGPVGVTGIHLQRTSDTVVRDSKLRDANLGGVSDAGWEAGGIKVVGSSGVTVERVEAYNNNGPGIWFDGASSTAVIRDNRVFSNTRAGIFFEISDGALIENNAVWANGRNSVAWGWGAGILVASSRDAEVRHNTVAWNADGIVVLSQNRTDNPGVVNNYIHDNNIALAPHASDPSDKFLLGWLQDGNGTMFSSGSNNRGANNQYWHSQPEPTWARFSWSGHLSSLSRFEATPGEAGGRYLTGSELDRALTDARMPAAP